MKRMLWLFGLGLFLNLFPRSAKAEITFRCDAAPGMECAFSVLHADGSGTTNFVLNSGETHGLNDNFAGGSYCVVVSKPRAQIRDWPPKCVCVNDGKEGKIIRNLKAGTSYSS